MLSKYHIIEILKDTFKSLGTNINGYRDKPIQVFVMFIILPILLSVLMIYFGIFVNKDLTSLLVSGLSIFCGLFFSLIIVVVDKVNKRKEQLSSQEDEEVRNYIFRYVLFSKSLIAQISFAIIICIVIILFILVLSVDFHFITNVLIKKYGKLFCHFIVFVLSIQFLLILYLIVSSMYSMFLEDIDLKFKKNN